MPVEVHLSRFSEDLSQRLPISREEWEACAKTIEGIELREDGIYTYSEKFQEMLPIFWLRDYGSGSMRMQGFFTDEISLIKAGQIAEYLQAFIYGEESSLIYIPSYGLVGGFSEYDSLSPVDITFDDLEEYLPTYGNDYKKIIDTVLQKKEEEKSKRPSYY